MLVHAWLCGRSLARGLPAPVPDAGGYRVDTRSEAEWQRWVFPAVGEDLIRLASRIHEPGRFIKVCATISQLRSSLPDRWQLHAPGYFMSAAEPARQRALPPGYELEISRSGDVTAARVVSPAGEVAASGFAAETSGAFVYDRIATDAGHRRMGLASVVMAALRSTMRDANSRELLVATPEGQALYRTLGWRTLSPYSTASIARPSVAPERLEVRGDRPIFAA